MSKTWLITGSANGLGRTIAETVLENGDRLVATARNPGRLDDLVATYGDRIRLAALDVTDAAAAKAAAKLAVDTFGGLDVLVNNAGFGHLSPFEQAPEDDFKAQIDTNFYGVVNLTRAVLPIMRERKSGHIINISSVGGRVATPGMSAYQAAKWAVGGFTEVLAKEVAAFGVKVIAVEPGGMRTNWAQTAVEEPVDILPEYEPSVGAMLSMLKSYGGSEFGDPRKVAKVIIDLSRRDALPAHLILGSDALFVFGLAEAARKKSEAEWEQTSRSTDFDGSDISVFTSGAFE